LQWHSNYLSGRSFAVVSAGETSTSINLDYWSSNNHMNVNFKKTKEMIINTSQSHCNFLDKLSVSGVEIERVNVFKLLGVHINQSLKWDDHVSAVPYVTKQPHVFIF